MFYFFCLESLNSHEQALQWRMFFKKLASDKRSDYSNIMNLIMSFLIDPNLAYQPLVGTTTRDKINMMKRLTQDNIVDWSIISYGTHFANSPCFPFSQDDDHYCSERVKKRVNWTCVTKCGYYMKLDQNGRVEYLTRCLCFIHEFKPLLLKCKK